MIALVSAGVRRCIAKFAIGEVREIILVVGELHFRAAASAPRFRAVAVAVDLRRLPEERDDRRGRTRFPLALALGVSQRLQNSLPDRFAHERPALQRDEFIRVERHVKTEQTAFNQFNRTVECVEFVLFGPGVVHCPVLRKCR